MIALLLLLSCAGPTERPPDASLDDTGSPLERPESVRFVPLDAPRLLRRMSLDLRGVLPSPASLDVVEKRPERLETFLDRYLLDPRLEERLVSLYAERWQTRLDEFEVDHWEYGFEDVDEYRYEKSIGEEPLRLMAWVAMEDRPWTEVVTSETTMANEVTAAIWPIDRPEGEGWLVSRYTDGRPAAGVLATNGMWWRYVTTLSNMNRARVAALVKLLACQDLLARPVELAGAVSLVDEDASAAAIRTEPTCQSCHATVEPIAAALFGFWTVTDYNPEENGYYHGERENMGPLYLGVAPAYFGQPVDGLAGLGVAITHDPRFYSCAVQTHTELLWRRDTDIQDLAALEALRRSFLTADIKVRPLLRAITDTEEYRAGGLGDGASAEDKQRVRTVRSLSPDQLGTVFKDATGFEWTWAGFEQLANDDQGYRTLLGGVDGYTVSKAQMNPGVTWTIAVQRLAEAAADTVVSRELVDGDSRKLLLQVELQHRPGDAVFDDELNRLVWRLHAVRLGDGRRLRLSKFWSEIEAIKGPAEAWRRVISALLRDPEMVGY
jgi:hypothetical protein